MANPRITVEINGDSSGLHKELGNADRGVMGFASSLKSLAGTLGIAFGVQQVVSFAGGLMKAADAARDTANALGESMQNIVGLTRLGAQAGVEQDKVLNWLQRVKQAQEEVIATNGTGATSRLLSGLGVDLNAFANAGPAKGLEMIVRAAGDAGDGIRTLNTVLGRLSSVDVKDALGRLATEGIDKRGESAAKAAEATARLANAQDRLDKAKAGFQEKSTGALASFFERAETINKGIGLGEGNLAGLLLSFSGLGSIAEGIGKMRGGAGKIDVTSAAARSTVDITGISPDAKEAAAKQKEVIDAQIDAAKSLKEYDWQNRFKSEMAGMTDDQLNAGIQAKRNFLNMENRMNFSKEDYNREFGWMQAMQAEVDRRATDRTEKEKRRADIIARGAENIEQIQAGGRSAIDGITVPLPRLSGIESLGAVLGGTGGAARSAAERQIKVLEVTNDTLKKIQESTKETAEALKE